MHGNPSAQAELHRLGVPMVPATVLHGRVVHGWNPADLAALVGVSYDEPPRLTPAALMDRLDAILGHAQNLAAAIPDDALLFRSPGRERNLRDLTFHVFRVGECFVDAVVQGRFPESWLLENAPPHIRTGEDLADYGRAVRERVAVSFREAPGRIYERTTATHYGEQQVHRLLERTVWHAGQHLRQMDDLLRRGGHAPALELPSPLFEGLPMPEGLW